MTVAQTLQGEAQAAIWQKLNPLGVLDSTLSGLGFTGVYDEVREDQVFDYISFGPTVEVPQNYLAQQRGYLCSVQLDIWSRQPGFKVAQQALSRLNQLIDQQRLTLATQVFVKAEYVMSQQLKDNDEFATRHIPVKYNIVSQEF